MEKTNFRKMKTGGKSAILVLLTSMMPQASWGHTASSQSCSILFELASHQAQPETLKTEPFRESLVNRFKRIVTRSEKYIESADLKGHLTPKNLALFSSVEFTLTSDVYDDEIGIRPRHKIGEQSRTVILPAGQIFINQAGHPSFLAENSSEDLFPYGKSEIPKFLVEDHALTKIGESNERIVAIKGLRTPADRLALDFSKMPVVPLSLEFLKPGASVAFSFAYAQPNIMTGRILKVFGNASQFQILMIDDATRRTVLLNSDQILEQRRITAENDRVTNDFEASEVAKKTYLKYGRSWGTGDEVAFDDIFAEGQGPSNEILNDLKELTAGIIQEYNLNGIALLIRRAGAVGRPFVLPLGPFALKELIIDRSGFRIPSLDLTIPFADISAIKGVARPFYGG